ncbi:hypothetical protein ANN_01368 [Periplaneta americana]|uniref:Ig-like domain-containing protein n=1 Tax=Periplaneta americana TaxID=6978 RepID=A0ABQ8TV11_PERAM|nr:hypothetical protein ANN_01368 [Periplaneta americana]
MDALMVYDAFQTFRKRSLCEQMITSLEQLDKIMENCGSMELQTLHVELLEQFIPVTFDDDDETHLFFSAFPSEDPMIEGILSTYMIGDYVTANCTSGKSNPPAVLTWQINGIQDDARVWEYRDGADETDSQGLHTKTVGLHFQIQNTHFTSNGGGLSPKMEIRCTSTVGGVSRHKSVFPTLARALTSNKLAQERYKNTAVNCPTTGLNLTSDTNMVPLTRQLGHEILGFTADITIEYHSCAYIVNPCGVCILTF